MPKAAKEGCAIGRDAEASGTPAPEVRNGAPLKPRREMPTAPTGFHASVLMSGTRNRQLQGKPLHQHRSWKQGFSSKV